MVISPWPNSSESSAEACEDSAPGSSPPPADSDLATGMPNTAVPIMTSTARAMTRRGAAMANRAIPVSTSPLLLLEFVFDEFAVEGRLQQLGMAARCLNAATGEHQYLVGMGDRRKPVCHHKHTAPAARLQ
jgi:hypothetical protein